MIYVVGVQFNNVGEANTDLVLRIVVGCFHVWQFPEGSKICLCFASSELMGFKSSACICLGSGTADRLKSLEKKISSVAP